MPLIRIVTNVAITSAEERRKVLTAFSSSGSELLGKPEDYVMVHLEQGQALTFGGSDDPACLIQLKNLGLREEHTEEYTRRLCDLAEIQLSVAPSRTYIEFSSPPRHMWGFDGHTFER